MNRMIIDGTRTTGSTLRAIEVVNPVNEEVRDAVPRGGVGDADVAVRAARRAFDPWRKLGAFRRTRLLHQVADKIRTRQAEPLRLLTLEEGKRLVENAEELDWVANTFHYYA